MADTMTFLALLAIWDDLPTLAGPQWATLEPRLTQLLETYQNTNDKRAREEISLDIQNVLDTVPAVTERFDDAFAEISDSGFEGTRTIPRPLTEFFERVGLHPRPKIFTRYTDIIYPRRVWLGKLRIQILVRLTLQPFASDTRQEELLVQSRQPVAVRIEAPGFELLNAAEQEVALPPDADSPYLVFDLRPQEVGHTSIVLDFFQAGNHIGTADLPVEITAQQLEPENENRATLPLPSGENVAHPDMTLCISYGLQDHTPSLFFSLRTHKIVEMSFTPVTLHQTPEAYTKQLYSRITSLTRRHDPTIQSVLDEDYRLEPADIEEQIKQIGQNLWKEVIPPELKQFYEQHRDGWRNRSLLIFSDEPHIPWELLWPYGTWGDEGPLCLQMRISRWLRRSREGEAIRTMEPALHLQNIAIIAPSDANLPAAQRERTFLLNLINQQGLHDASPVEPTRPLVNRLLQKGPYDWFHVAAHGNFYPEDPDGASAIWLKDRLPLNVEAIVGEAEIYISEHRSAFIFNACSAGRQGWSLTGIGGWAERLINAGASLFLAPQWVVKDGASLKFCKEVYRSLLAGETVAEAVRQGRLAARRAGDPSWLAYSLYAHPNARLVDFPRELES